MTDIERIKTYLKEFLGFNAVFTYYDETLRGSDDMVGVMVVAPHEDNDHKWVLCLSPLVSFDSWENSRCIEEHFESPEDIHWYLYECESDIYYRLFECVSREFWKMREANDEWREAERAKCRAEWGLKEEWHD